MPNPSDKHPAIENFLEGVAGRTTSIQESRCVPPPFGCGKPVSQEDFRDELSRREYAISGLCQTCQDSVFGGGEDDE